MSADRTPSAGADTWSYTDSGERVHIYPRCPAIVDRNPTTVSSWGEILDASDRELCSICGYQASRRREPIYRELQESENAEIGATVELYVCNQWPELERVVDEDLPLWFDAVARDPIETSPESRVPGVTVVQEGTPVDAKAAALRTHDGGRRGRFWIRRSHHERLLEADGEYALVAYERLADTSLVVDRAALTPARTVDILLEAPDRDGDRWYAAGDDHRAEECGQLPISVVFDLAEGSS